MIKWDYKTRTYQPYAVPKEWYCPLYLDQMMAVVNCASCGQKMIYGIGFSSLEIHNSMGMGHIVCEDCYRAEWERKRKAEWEI